jgi:LemA protein
MILNDIWMYIILIIIVVVILYLIKSWISTYNKFHYWYEKAKEIFSDIDVVMQERMDKIHALAQIVKKYDIHEYKTLTDVIEARSGWNKDLPLNEKVKMASEVENNFFKLQAVFEQYPNLKADALHHRLLSKDSHVESRLRKTRMKYNNVVRKYNYRVKKFPRSIIAKRYGFEPLEYLSYEESETYKPKEILND